MSILNIAKMVNEKMEKIDKAIGFAKLAHAGIEDDGGVDYYDAHLHPVGLMITSLTDDTDVVCAAILHDTLEDTKTTYEDLVKFFGKRVADLVHEVTHEKFYKDGYQLTYFPRLKSKDAIMIKLCDRVQNISRMGSWNEGRKQRYLNRSKFWYSTEEEAVKNAIDNHKIPEEVAKKWLTT